MTYTDSDHCQAQLADIEAIDYFLADRLSSHFSRSGLTEKSPKKESDPLLFHLILAAHEAVRLGHSCLDLDSLDSQLRWATNEEEVDSRPGFQFPSLDAIQRCLESLPLRPDDHQPLVREDQRLYLRRYWQFECEVGDALASRLEFDPLPGPAAAEMREFIGQLFQSPDQQTEDKPSVTNWQQVAVANALGRRFSIISGGPGTGKTYTVTRLLAALQKLHNGELRIAMAAPTGKAAQRLIESIRKAKLQMAESGIDPELLSSIPEQASTLHRLLGYRPQSVNLRHHQGKPLCYDLVVIDEASMIDLPMMARLLRALPEKASLILLGDANQLPSVAAGSILSDLTPRPHPGYSDAAARQITQLTGVSENAMKKPACSVHHGDYLTLLNQSHRFDDKGDIGRLAEQVINADCDGSWNQIINNRDQDLPRALESNTGLAFLGDLPFQATLYQLAEHYYLPLHAVQGSHSRESGHLVPGIQHAFAALARFRILTPTRIGNRGVEALNRQIELHLARRASGIKPGQHYPGRPIMVTRNHYGAGLFNGDMGLIWRNTEGNLVAVFEGDAGLYRQVSLARLPEVEPVHAMTIHKTQGSEFQHVALILPENPSPNLSPELLYTGITRARERLLILGAESVWRSAMDDRVLRFSGLRERLG